MPSQLEHAMETLMFTFHKYAGDKEHLAKEDLRALMDKEFPGFLEVGSNPRNPGMGSYKPQDQTPQTQDQIPQTLGSNPRNSGMGPHKLWDQTSETPRSDPIESQDLIP